MNKLLHYKPRIICEDKNFNSLGIKKFSHFFKIFNHDVIIVDRTNVIKLPIVTESLFPLPIFRVFEKKYEDICNDRAREILKTAEIENLPIHVLYSGGIDSTLVLISLLKNSTEEQKKNITVLLSQESISENPNFYKDHIQGKLKVAPSANFPYVLGNDVLFVTGEHNDQIFGSDVIGKLMKVYGDDVIKEPYSRNLFINFFNSLENNPEVNIFYVNLFEKLCAKAPIKIETNFHFLWWINFSLKWQSVFIRVLSYVSERNVSKITKKYTQLNYLTFYGTEEFQLWSMNNLDKRIKKEWSSYKWVCKDIIYAYTKDEDYRDNKTKVGSLSRIMVGSGSFSFIDNNFTFSKDLNIKDFYANDNDFI